MSTPRPVPSWQHVGKAMFPCPWRCWTGGWINVTKVLLEKGADMHAKDHRGMAPLHHACEKASLTEVLVCTGHAEVVKALVERRVDTHAEDSNGRTPLYYALYRGRRKEGVIVMA